ncbi:hypothetical protein KUV85_03470 [Nocardioides panacisoli]|uniref:hypothetical protein n=1 Tax=Nocardioides panacisoli TaxID=627624 RepID=UPI001C639BFD|nr:hypothetical protein [Nocardioides panacisoli]QYJ04755.1 hypothetical protein KUV85_03470 [Nocardioides panacisoli]
MSTPTPPPPPPPPVPGTRRGVLRRVLVAVGILAGAAGLGWVAGQAWWQWWSPAPTGFVYETAEGLRWIAEPVDAGSAQLFSATGQYVAIGSALGVLLGCVVAALTRGWELAGLAVGLVAAALAAVVMVTVGTDLSPPDPASLVEEAGAGAELRGALQVPGWSPHVAWPAGLLLGHLAVTLLAPRRPRGSSVGGEPVARHVGGGQRRDHVQRS